MHNNYYFFLHLSKKLDSQLSGGSLSSIYSQNKDELILKIEKEKEPYSIRASLLPEFSVLSFPADLKRTRRNSVDLFRELIGKCIQSISVIKNDRSMLLELDNGHQLVFKMHGSRSNVLLFRNGELIDLFKNNMASDKELVISDLEKSLDQSWDHFKSTQGNLKALFPTFGPTVINYLNMQGYSVMSLEEQWELVGNTLKFMEKEEFYIINGPSLKFSLLPFETILATFNDPIEAVNVFQEEYTKQFTFTKLQNTLLSVINKQMKQAHQYIMKTSKELDKLTNSDHNRTFADLIMANLNRVPPNSEEVTLNDFYTGNPVTIPLKPRLSPQKNAEIYYRKAKNQHIQEQKVREAIAKKERLIKRLEKQKDTIEQAAGYAELKALNQRFKLLREEEKEQESKPFRAFTHMGYQILVGKSAKANDEVTFKYGWKDDLWLHAKDATGSHVVIKHKSGQNFPKPVIERAAQLAAFYSKKKSEKLCPVIFTQVKFVRKKKGYPPGQVLVEKETLILVEPIE